MRGWYVEAEATYQRAAVFNTTYNAQARVDAELTNGADVLVRGTTTAPPGSKLPELVARPAWCWR